MKKSFASKVKKRVTKKTTATTTADAYNSSSESEDEMSYVCYTQNSADITQDLLDLELTDDDAMDYEPGGDY